MKVYKTRELVANTKTKTFDRPRNRRAVLSPTMPETFPAASAGGGGVLDFRGTLNQLQDSASTILSLAREWQDVEERFDCAKLEALVKKERELEERVCEMEARKRTEREWLEKSLEESEVLRDLVEGKLGEVAEMEERFEVLKRAMEEIEVKERRMEARERKLEEGFKQLALKERGIEAKEKKLEEGFKELSLEKRRFENIEKRVKAGELEIEKKGKEFNVRESGFAGGVDLRRKLNELRDKKFAGGFKEIKLKEEQLRAKLKEVELKYKKFEGRFNERKLKEEQLEAKLKDVELKDMKDEGGLKEIKLKEEQLKAKLKEVELKGRKVEGGLKEIKLKEDQLERQRWEFELNEKKLEKGFRDINLKEEELAAKCQEVELKDKKLEERLMEIKLKEEQLERQCGEVELKEKTLEEGLREIKLKEEKIGAKCERVELKHKKLGEGFRKIKLKERTGAGCGEVELQQMKLEEGFIEIKLKEEQLEAKCREVELKDKKLDEGFKEIKMKEEQLEKQHRETLWRDKKLEEQFKDLELKEKQLEALFAERFEKLELKEKQLKDQCREVEMKEKRALNTQVKEEPLDDANICFSVIMDGKALQMFLNERWKEHDLLRNDVLGALRYSSNPARLVLDALQGFYPPHLKKGEVEFEKCAVQRSCILLLDQLMKISPPIESHVMEEAVKLSFDWMTKMTKDADHSFEVLGFLQVVASYGLASVFDADELLNCLEIVAQHSQAIELFRALGFGDKIPCFVHNLLRKNWLLEAIRYIYEFKIVNEFPPAPILKRYLQISKANAKRIKRRGKSLEAEIEATNKRVADIKAALTCIEDYNIKCEVSSENLKQMIRSMETENLMSKSKVATKGRKTQLKTICSAPKVVAAAAPAPAPAPAPADVLKFPSHGVPPIKTSPPTASTASPAPNCPSQQQIGVKRPLTAVSEVDDPKASIHSSVATSKIFPGQQPEQIAWLEKQKEEKMCISGKFKSEAGPCTGSKSELVDDHNKKESDHSTTTPVPSTAPPSTTVTSPSSTCTPAPATVTENQLTTPATVTENQLQQQNENKRRRTIVSTQKPPKASVSSAHIGYNRQPPRQLPPGPFMYMNVPSYQYCLVGYPPRDMHPRYQNVIPRYNWDPRGNPGHVWPIPFRR